jgi:hypothetical protein
MQVSPSSCYFSSWKLQNIYSFHLFSLVLLNDFSSGSDTVVSHDE